MGVFSLEENSIELRQPIPSSDVILSMRRMDEMMPACGNAEPGEPPWAKDDLVARLREEGHRPIAVGRAVLVVEQCEPGEGAGARV